MPRQRNVTCPSAICASRLWLIATRKTSRPVFEEGYCLVNPLSVRKQIEGQLAWAYDDTMYQATTIKDGRAVEVNFDTFPVSRMNEYPKEVNIQFFKTKRWITGAEAIPPVPPAILNAVFKIAGKRIRSIPIKDQDLSWG